jgi:Ca2+-binding RTX toxin-like protein
MRTTVIALLLLAIAPVATARAGALTVSTYMECNGDIACSKYMAGTTEFMLRYTGTPGERNVVVIEPAGSRIRVTDTGAAIAAEDKCEHVSPTEALCPFPRLTIVELGDQDDTVTISAGAKTSVNGDEGDDTITGGRFAERIDGGPGRDHVDAGGGNDTLVGTLNDPGPDVLDGGPGLDLLTYAGRKDDVVVNFRASDRPFLDLFSNVEDATGGDGNDTLIGADTAQTLDGGAGDDRVIGNGGNDRLIGGPGRDKLSGGDGSDTLSISDHEADNVVCGTGSDGVLQLIEILDYYSEEAWRGADAGDVLGRDCERVALAGPVNALQVLTVDPRVHATGGRAWVRNPCATIKARPCEGTIRVGRTRRRFRAGGQRIVLPLRRVPVRVAITTRVVAAGSVHTGAWTADSKIVG